MNNIKNRRDLDDNQPRKMNTAKNNIECEWCVGAAVLFVHIQKVIRRLWSKI